jgi:hypothetical protein
MLTTIAIALIGGFVFLLEALREMRNNRRKANADDALRRALDHGFVEEPLSEEEIAALHAARRDGDR